MKTIDDVIDLVRIVPRAPEQPLPSGADEREIERLEDLLTYPLPQQLREWLFVYNARNIGPGGIFGVAPAEKGRLIEEYFRLFPTWLSKAWIPVAGDGCGNYYILDASDQTNFTTPIYFIDHEYGYDEPSSIVGSRLFDFLWTLLQSEL
ncbi:MAG: SMI1/KNR4 family protein [Capsulimonas sp.]|uniref:SMI1/KNR4 family protein n=1 Tax=Capsulimonas sp. TaxID=2494211 RepID=UPI003263A737